MEPLFRWVKRFEQAISALLMALMAIVVTMSAAELAWLIAVDSISPPLFLFDATELLDIFAMFLLVLVGVELMETLKEYIRQSELRAEIIVMVAIIALARKIITLDFKDQSGASLAGIAALLVSLSIAYFVVKRSFRTDRGRGGAGGA